MSEAKGSHQQKLADMMSRQEIRDTLARYARGVDRADAAMLKSCYHEDAIEEHGPNYSGSAMAYIDGAMERLQGMGELAHYICNSHIELEGDTAWVETYVITFARVKGEGGDMDTFTGGRLCDKFERRNDQWLIAYRKITFDWNNDIPSNQAWCQGLFDPSAPGFHYGSKDRNDLSYQRF